MPRYLMALLALCAPLLAGCDSNDDDEGNDVFGLWFADDLDSDEQDVYLDISSNELTTYVFIEDTEGEPEFEPCYFVQTVDVISRDGDVWVIEDSEGEQYEATIRVEDDELVVISEGDTTRLVRSSADPDAFTPECLFDFRPSR